MTLKLQDKDTSGLKRIVMINSGQSDYVELEVGGSLHLVGDNGVGKSMILSTIQFVMIDDWRSGKMKLSKGALKPKKFYFPNTNSYIIFETEDTSGLRTLFVLKGKGLTNQYDIEKWIIQGCWYDSNLFITKDQNGKISPCSWGEVKRNLESVSSTPMRKMSTSERVKFLTDYLGWLPKKGLQKQFSNLYLQFLKLGSIKHRELAELIIASSLEKDMRTEIDVQESFAPTWNKIRDMKAKLTTLNENINGLQKIIDADLTLNSRQEKLQERWYKLNPSVGKWYADSKVDSDEINLKLSNMDKLKQDIEDKISKKSEERDLQLSEQAIKKSDYDGLLENKKFAESFNLKENENKIKNLDDEVARLTSLIEGGKQYDLEELLTKEKDLKEQINENTIFLEENQQTLDHNLRSIGLSQEQLQNAFRVLDPNSLKRKGTISDQLKAINLIEKLDASVTEANLAIFEGITFELGRIPDLPNIEAITRKLESDHKELERIGNLIEAANKKKEYDELIKTMKGEIFQAKQEKLRFEDWENKGKQNLTDLEKTLADLNLILIQLDEELKEARNQKSNLKSVEDELLQRKDELAQRETLRRIFLECQTELRITSIPNMEFSDTVENISKEINRISADSKALASDIELQSKDIELAKTKLQHVVRGVTEQEFIAEAKDKIKGYEKSQQALDKLFTDLLINISSKASGLSTSLRYVKRTVDRLNAEIGKKTITHLDEIKIKFEPRDSIVESLQSVSELTSFSRFDKTMENNTEYKTLKKVLEESQRIDLINLFSITVYIRKPGDNELRKIGSIDDSGSEGTITAIKCHLMMLIMNMMLGKKRSKLPLFLDEIGTLGDLNYKQIIDMATSLNFQILTASPKAVEFVEKQHLVVGYGEGKRLRIWPNHYHGEILEA